MLNVYPGFNIFGQAVVNPPPDPTDPPTPSVSDVTVICDGVVISVGSTPSGTVAEQLEALGSNVVTNTIGASGKSCFIQVTYPIAKNKLDQQTELLGAAPVDNNGLGYNYPSS